jgi:hypothetical protein
MKNGTIIEAKRGHYDNYGACIPENKWDDFEVGHSGEYWQSDIWTKLVEMHFNNKKDTGFVIYHEKCYKGQRPKTISKDDPNQGWGNRRLKFERVGKAPLCRFCHKPSKEKYCSKECEKNHILWGI